MDASVARALPAPMTTELLLDRADTIVRDVLERNARRWDSSADAELATALARAVVDRLLAGPLDHLVRCTRSDDLGALAAIDDLMGL